MQTQQGSQTAKNFVLPKNPEMALKMTIQNIEALEDVYEREMEALKNTDTRGFMSLQDEKMQKAEIYQANVMEIIKRKKEMKDVNPALKTQLKDMQARFSKMAKENLKEIQRTQKTVVRLGDTIRKAAKDAAKRTHGISYSQTGQMENEETRRVSMGVNETA